MEEREIRLKEGEWQDYEREREKECFIPRINKDGNETGS